MRCFHLGFSIPTYRWGLSVSEWVLAKTTGTDSLIGSAALVGEKGNATGSVTQSQKTGQCFGLMFLKSWRPMLEKMHSQSFKFATGLAAVRGRLTSSVMCEGPCTSTIE